jgi:soluble lytic murein transglycosylase-like protein
MVLSNRPHEGAVRTYSVERSASLRATRPADQSYENRYDDLIDAYARQYGVRGDLVRAVIQVESGFNPRARSSKGAMGLMQLMSGTASDLGVTNPYNPEENIRGGVAYLRTLLDRYSNDEQLALAAYNAGPGAVDRYGNRVPPYRETRDYVNRVQNASPGTSRRSKTIYKTVEYVNGRAVPRYSDTKPSTGTYEVVSMGPGSR